MSDITVVIPKKEYIRLLQSELKLEKLEAGGVNNWEWYSESLNEGGDFWEECEDIEKYVNGI